jgi:hypothetical protein
LGVVGRWGSCPHPKPQHLGRAYTRGFLEALKRRFGKLTTHINGGMFLGHDVEHEKVRRFIMLRLRTCNMERVIQSVIAKGTEDTTLNSNVGILNFEF